MTPRNLFSSSIDKFASIAQHHKNALKSEQQHKTVSKVAQKHKTALKPAVVPEHSTVKKTVAPLRYA